MNSIINGLTVVSNTEDMESEEFNQDRLPLARIVPDNSIACPPSMAARLAAEQPGKAVFCVSWLDSSGFIAVLKTTISNRNYES